MPKKSPPSRIAPNSVLTIVGFILMKVSLCSQSVSAPNTNTTMPETSGMMGRVRVIVHEMASAITVAPMNSAVARKIGAPMDASTGKRSISISPRALAKKKTRSGPSSSASLSSGGTSRRSASLFCDGSRSKTGCSIRQLLRWRGQNPWPQRVPDRRHLRRHR